MGASAVPVAIITAFWFIIGGVLPFLLPKSQHRGQQQTVLILTGVCSWMFWLLCYLAQMNPLIGPQIKIDELLIIQKEWGCNPEYMGKDCLK